MPKCDEEGVIIGNRIDYNGVGALRGQRHTVPNKLNPLPPPPSATVSQAPWGYSHTLPIWVCAAQRGRDFEAPGLERGIPFRGVF